MVLKTFNLSEESFTKFSKYCKENGLSMSKQIDFFIQSQMGEPKLRLEYLKKLERIRKGKFIRVNIDDIL